jgi:hypothetical protein
VFSNRDLSGEIELAKKIKIPSKRVEDSKNTQRLIEDLDQITKTMSDNNSDNTGLGKTWTFNTNKISPKAEIRIKVIPEVPKKA